ncbi:MAG: hypothetical protein CMJ58_22555 [Planctomycetaceae bacterium]|nr:hypothetical protein [Planctomycetaceae bacterium]
MLQLVAALTVSVAAVSQPAAPAVVVDEQVAAPQWHSDYGTALDAARHDDRPLLVVIDSPQNAEQSVAADLLEGEATAKLLAKYNLCRVDASTPYGKKVVDAFGAKTLPHVAIIDKAGAVVLHKQSGAINADRWISTLVKHQSGQRVAQIAHSTFYRGDVNASTSTPVSSGMSFNSLNGNVIQSSPTVTSPGYCPSCQRQAMGY